MRARRAGGHARRRTKRVGQEGHTSLISQKQPSATTAAASMSSISGSGCPLTLTLIAVELNLTLQSRGFTPAGSFTKAVTSVFVCSQLPHDVSPPFLSFTGGSCGAPLAAASACSAYACISLAAVASRVVR